jgi:4-diphosphocytidyl-2-C-methyl-D-erythritol kinase
MTYEKTIMLVRAPAKINSFLRILAKENSGYHQIETFFTAVDFCDEIHLSLSDDKISLNVVGVELGSAEDNLVYKAVTAFFALVDYHGGIEITLNKNIPTGAGLGGGSSDAGAMIRALNLIFDRPCSPEELMGISCGIGSDVPFFTSGLGSALAWGRGERLMPMKFRSYVLLALPSVAINTTEAYEALDIQRKVTTAAVFPGSACSLEDLAGMSLNEFESMTFSRYPELGKIRKDIEKAGAPVARLSGSGGTLFGLFYTKDEVEAACRELRKSWPNVRFVITETLDSQPQPEVLG